jgi:hypothetical protein
MLQGSLVLGMLAVYTSGWSWSCAFELLGPDGSWSSNTNKLQVEIISWRLLCLTRLFDILRVNTYLKQSFFTSIHENSPMAFEIHKIAWLCEYLSGCCKTALYRGRGSALSDINLKLTMKTHSHTHWLIMIHWSALRCWCMNIQMFSAGGGPSCFLGYTPSCPSLTRLLALDILRRRKLSLASHDPTALAVSRLIFATVFTSLGRVSSKSREFLLPRTISHTSSDYGCMHVIRFPLYSSASSYGSSPR